MSDKFNTIMPESEGCVLCIMVDKPISGEGYRENYLTRAQKIIEEYGELRLLVHFKKYQGWEREAAAMDLGATQAHALMTRCAMVNPPPTLIALHELRKDVFKAQMRLFNEDELDEALRWIKEEK